MRNYDEAEGTGKIDSSIYVGGDSAFLKDHVYRVNVSERSESSNAAVLS